MSHWHQWLKSVEDSLRTHPEHYWKYVFSFKRKDNSCIQIKIDKKFITDSKHVADAFANYFKSIFNLNLASGNFTSLWKQTAVVPLFKKGDSTIVRKYTYSYS
jgi:hypothetical protein